MKKMLIMCGLPGSGKSTAAREFAYDAEAVGQTAIICSTDDFFVVDGVYKFDAGHLFKNHRLNQEKAAKACADGVDLVIIDNTNIEAKHRAIYEDIAAKHGFACETFVVGEFTPDFVKVCAERNQHGVPLASIQKMAARIQLPAHLQAQG